MFSSTATSGRNVSAVSSWKLEASTTQAPPGAAAGVPTASASGSPRLPPDERRAAGRAHDVAHQRRRRRLAVGAGDRDQRARHEARRQLHLARDRHAGRARRRQLGDLGDARRQHDQLGAGERLAPVPAQLARDCGRQPGQRGAQRAPRRACPSRSRGRRAPRTAAPPRSRSARDRPRARVCDSDPSGGSHLTFRVVMRPRIAQANETIQKRTTILDSGQPSFSKWWWIGAIRKMRFLVFL